MIDFVARRHLSPSGMTRDFTVTLPLRIESPLNGSQGISRGAAMGKARKRREQRQAVRWTIMALTRSEAVKLPVNVVITRVAPRKLDDDNFRAGAKSVRDGVADAFCIRDDDERIAFHYEQARGEPKQYVTRITIAQRSA